MGYVMGKCEGVGENWHGHVTAVTVGPDYRRLGRIFTGILRDKTMADKLMYNSNKVTQNYPFCRLKLVVETFQKSIL